MAVVTVTFTHEGKEYNGNLGFVFGMGEHCWHLTIDGHYWGRLRRPNGQWVFDPTSKDPWLKDYAEYFGNIVEGSKRELEPWEE